ncbi:MAG: hypothetical protein O3C40_25510 [Planctomycetota bacterium]|nr:hypothetical protein [Planctomycetota bacterium]
MSDRQSCKFVLAKPRQQVALIDQRPFAPDSGESLPRLVSQVRFQLAGILATSNRHCIDQRPTSRRVEQLVKFGLGQRSPLSRRFRFLIRSWHIGNRIDQQPPGPHTPVCKTDQRFAVTVASTRGHPFRLAGIQPADERCRFQILQPAVSAFGSNPFQLRASVFDASRANARRFLMRQVIVEVSADRPVLIFGRPVLGSGQDVRLDQFGPAHQIRQHLPRCSLVSAAGWIFDDDSRTIAILRGEGPRSNHNASLAGVRSFGWHGYRRGSRSPFRAFPTCNALALAFDEFSAGG